ncbi:probable carboxylesterase 12 [Humulus lupulus]|uniref:probable carboxylesterase 12 n=1 Tax=Humulus lupulus TaxID=3486 RepID=UPI002B40673D|nr:probable carboxylesterase 12 [Humulus lupulus]
MLLMNEDRKKAEVSIIFIMNSVISSIQRFPLTCLHFSSSIPSHKIRLQPTTTKLFRLSSTLESSTPTSTPTSISTSPTTTNTSTDAMAALPTDDVAHDFSPFLKIYKDGHIERLVGIDVVPPSLDPKTGVESKDVVISPETGVKARLYVPNSAASQPQKKLPLVVYFHGGGFCVETPFCAKYHNAVNNLVAEANVVAVSVDYRLAPENPIPIAYDDSWAAVKWVVSHSGGTGPDEWLNSLADHKQVFFAGDSAGANIAHHMALRAGLEGGLVGSSDDSKLVGVALIHPYFWGAEPVGDEAKHPEKAKSAEGIWRFACPTTSGVDDPYINPAKDPNLKKLGCDRVLVCVAENDLLKDRGFYYKEILEKSGWGGTVEVVEATGDDHVFHLSKPTCDNAVAMLKKISSFIKQD